MEVLAGFPEDCAKAIEEAEKVDLGPVPTGNPDSLVVAGMGGSAVGGTILGDWLQEESRIPIQVSRGYHLPGYVNEDTLVFVVSYSGNTEETLSAFQEATSRGCPVATFTSGGTLARLSSERGLPCFRLPPGMRPRAALPYQFFSLATAARRLGVFSEAWGEVDEALEVLRDFREMLRVGSPTSSNPAKRLAYDIKGYVPFVYGPPIFRGVAYRYSTQFNENGKTPAGWGYFPEAFHNAVMTREAPKEIAGSLCAVIIMDPMEGEIMAKKIEGFKKLMESSIGRILEVQAYGTGRLARILSAQYVGDYASAYLGLLQGFDPSSTDSIEALKGI